MEAQARSRSTAPVRPSSHSRHRKRKKGLLSKMRAEKKKLMEAIQVEVGSDDIQDDEEIERLVDRDIQLKRIQKQQTLQACGLLMMHQVWIAGDNSQLSKQIRRVKPKTPKSNAQHTLVGALQQEQMSTAEPQNPLNMTADARTLLEVPQLNPLTGTMTSMFSNRVPGDPSSPSSCSSQMNRLFSPSIAKQLTSYISSKKLQEKTYSVSTFKFPSVPNTPGSSPQGITTPTLRDPTSLQVKQPSKKEMQRFPQIKLKQEQQLKSIVEITEPSLQLASPTPLSFRVTHGLLSPQLQDQMFEVSPISSGSSRLTKSRIQAADIGCQTSGLLLPPQPSTRYRGNSSQFSPQDNLESSSSCSVPNSATYLKRLSRSNISPAQVHHPVQKPDLEKTNPAVNQARRPSTKKHPTHENLQRAVLVMSDSESSLDSKDGEKFVLVQKNVFDKILKKQHSRPKRLMTEIQSQVMTPPMNSAVIGQHFKIDAYCTRSPNPNKIARQEPPRGKSISSGTDQLSIEVNRSYLGVQSKRSKFSKRKKDPHPEPVQSSECSSLSDEERDVIPDEDVQVSLKFKRSNSFRIKTNQLVEKMKQLKERNKNSNTPQDSNRDKIKNKTAFAMFGPKSPNGSSSSSRKPPYSKRRDGTTVVSRFLDFKSFARQGADEPGVSEEYLDGSLLARQVSGPIDLEQRFTVIKSLEADHTRTMDVAIDRETEEKVILEMVSKQKLRRGKKGPLLYERALEYIKRLKNVNEDHVAGLTSVIEQPSTSQYIYVLSKFYPQSLSLAFSLEHKNLKFLEQTREASNCRRVGLDSARIQSYFVALLKGLYYLHEQLGVAHRNVRPENLMLTPTDSGASQIVLTRIGILPVAENITLSINTEGNLNYFPPEMWAWKGALTFEQEKANDLWALGSTLYRLLTGFLPIENVISSTKFYQKLTGQSINFDKISCPLARQAVSQMLSLNPQHRPSLEDLSQLPWALNLEQLNFSPKVTTVSAMKRAATQLSISSSNDD